MARPNPEEPTLLELTIEEAKGIARQGLAHRSTRPVLAGAAIGTLIAALLPFTHWPLGLFAGAVIALMHQARR